MMDNFIIGFAVSLVLILMFILFDILGHEGESADIAEQCKSYSMATIDNKAYNCTLKEVKP